MVGGDDKGEPSGMSAVVGEVEVEIEDGEPSGMSVVVVGGEEEEERSAACVFVSGSLMASVSAHAILRLVPGQRFPPKVGFWLSPRFVLKI